VPLSFDGVNKLIIASVDMTSVDAITIYSRWKDWVVTADNAKYPVALSVVGGDPIGGGVSITPYVFIQNGWKVRPLSTTSFEVTGNLLPESGQSLFNFAPGVRPETVRTLALKSETVSTASPQQADIDAIRGLLEADEVHTPTTIQKRQRGTPTVLLTKNVTGTPLSNFQAVQP